MLAIIIDTSFRYDIIVILSFINNRYKFNFSVK